MSFVSVKNSRTATKSKSSERKRAASGSVAVGGSVYNKVVNGATISVLSVVSAFQEKHKLSKMKHVHIRFDPKTKVMALEFVKEKGDGTFSIDHDKSGTAFIRITPALKAFGLKLTSDLRNEEYVFDKDGNMLVDLSDSVSALSKNEKQDGRNTAVIAEP